MALLTASWPSSDKEVAWTSNTMRSPNLMSGAEVMRKGSGSSGFKAASTCSICTFTPPVLMVLSFLPMTRNCLERLNSTMSFVVSRSGHTSGASMTNVFSSDRESATWSKGVYHSDASGPFNFRKAMCERVSVMP